MVPSFLLTHLEIFLLQLKRFWRKISHMCVTFLGLSLMAEEIHRDNVILHSCPLKPYIKALHGRLWIPKLVGHNPLLHTDFLLLFLRKISRYVIVSKLCRWRKTSPFLVSSPHVRHLLGNREQDGNEAIQQGRCLSSLCALCFDLFLLHVNFLCGFPLWRSGRVL